MSPGLTQNSASNTCCLLGVGCVCCLLNTRTFCVLKEGTHTYYNLKWRHLMDPSRRDMKQNAYLWTLNVFLLLSFWSAWGRVFQFDWLIMSSFTDRILLCSTEVHKHSRRMKEIYFSCLTKNLKTCFSKAPHLKSQAMLCSDTFISSISTSHKSYLNRNYI